MTAIKFKKIFYKQIKNGIKTQTLRIPQKRLDLKKYDFATCIFEGCDEQIYVTITDVGYKDWRSLTVEDARREGFATVDDLKQCLRMLYPSIPSWGRLYYYRFKVEGVTEKIEG